MLAERLSAQLLSGPPARSVAAVCERLLAVQGQDPRGFRLAVRARTEGLTAADVDRALDDGDVLVTWLNRGTLHLVRAEDYPWLHAVTAPRQRTGILRRLEQEGVGEPARGVEVIERAIAADGPLTREQLRPRVAAACGEAAGAALYQLLALAAQEGRIVRGPTAGKQHAYVLVREWLGDPAPVDRDVALAELARRYLAGHGPATDRDLAQWAGVGLRDARAGLKAIAAEVVERRAPATLPPPRLLGAFDPILLGWSSRDFVTGPHRAALVRGGMFAPFALVNGTVAATWGLPNGRVALSPLAEIAPEDAAALDAEALSVRRFLGL